MDADTFRRELRRRFDDNRARTLLRIGLSSAAQPVELTGGAVLEQAQALANRYAGAECGNVVLLLLPHSAELFLLHLGLVLQGQVPAILPWPTSRVDPGKYRQNLLHQLRELPAAQLVTLPKVAASFGPHLPYPTTPCPIEAFEQHEAGFVFRPDESPVSESKPGRRDTLSDALFLQFSGGTTASQKSIVVTARMLGTQLDRLRDALNFSSEDGVVSWLPMYHDMGLIACFWFPLWHGAPSFQFSASEWLINPELLFAHIDRYRATFSWLPNFAFSYLADQRHRMAGPHSLAHVRAWINCSEPVRLRSMLGFVDAYHTWGVTRSSLRTSYAMAENVFAVTQSRSGEMHMFGRAGLRDDRTARKRLAYDLVEDMYVSSGEVLSGTEVRIRRPNRRVCAEGEPGAIEIRSESLFSGYWGAEGVTSASFREDGWHDTGDYGFIAGTDLYVIGREKDIVIVGGQNVFPEDVETAVGALNGIYPGRAVAFGVPDERYDTEALAVVAEMKGTYRLDAAQALEREIHRAVLAAVGVAPRYVLVAPERWIVKSTAGKPSRSETRQRFLGLHHAAAPVADFPANLREPKHDTSR